MARFYGVIGYAQTVEKTPGNWSVEVTERNHIGDVIRNYYSERTASDSTNDDLNINNQISIIADSFASQNFLYMRYAEFMGVKWKITNVEVSYPRLILTLGGVYNG